MQAETALPTEKGGLRLAISFFAMSALRTGSTRIPGVNKPHTNARPCCLVGNIRSQLVEGPGMPFVAVLTPNRCPVPDASEVFKGKCLACTNGFVYQGLRYSVVYILLEALLASREFLETALGGASTNP